MKPSTVPTLCSISLAAMAAAGASHWWSVDQWVAASPASIPLHSLPQSVKKTVESPQTDPVPPTLAQESAASQKTPTPDSAQKNFYEGLIKKMETLQNENRDLVDQMAETNRDMMKLEFRVDTHSESFRPLPTTESQSDASFDDGPGVLPPIALPVLPGLDQ